MTTEPLDAADMQRLRRQLAARYAAEVLEDDPGWVADDGSPELAAPEAARVGRGPGRPR
jgi:hypothetical protein